MKNVEILLVIRGTLAEVDGIWLQLKGDCTKLRTIGQSVSESLDKGVDWEGGIHGSTIRLWTSGGAYERVSARGGYIWLEHSLANLVFVVPQFGLKRSVSDHSIFVYFLLVLSFLLFMLIYCWLVMILRVLLIWSPTWALTSTWICFWNRSCFFSLKGLSLSPKKYLTDH